MVAMLRQIQSAKAEGNFTVPSQLAAGRQRVEVISYLFLVIDCSKTFS